MEKKIALPLLCIWACVAACSAPSSDQNNTDTSPPYSETDVNPAAPGFHMSSSTPKAIEIADQVMVAVGGRKAWDETRYLKWNFFGMRSLLWDRAENRVRIDFEQQDLSIIYNQEDMSGMVRKDGELLTHPDSVAKYVEMGDKIWVNDAYWLFMPFKLKDDGVTLTYVGEDTTAKGAAAHLLQLTFEDIGYTPQNKYNVWVDKETNLVAQWAYFPNADDESPRFTMPWADYKAYGAIKLSGNRGERQITDIAVPQQVPDAIFEQFD